MLIVTREGDRRCKLRPSERAVIHPRGALKRQNNPTDIFFSHEQRHEFEVLYSAVAEVITRYQTRPRAASSAHERIVKVSRGVVRCRWRSGRRSRRW
jgi:hypothetical protein